MIRITPKVIANPNPGQQQNTHDPDTIQQLIGKGDRVNAFCRWRRLRQIDQRRKKIHEPPYSTRTASVKLALIKTA
jgi:hypothetical protein